MISLDEMLKARDAEALNWVQAQSRRDRQIGQKVALFLLEGQHRDEMPVTLINYQAKVLEMLEYGDDNETGAPP